MSRGMRAVVAKLDDQPDGDIAGLAKLVAMTLISSVGGASGPLYGTFFLQVGTSTAGKEDLGPEDWAAALEAGIAGVRRRGKAEPGDKTMIDALEPGLAALRGAIAGGAPLGEALGACADAAEEGMRATIPLVARKGRASYLGERSAGHQDPGATSSYLLLRSAAETLAG
jgi:dihydroxyacetone kinase-like protein